MKTTSPMIEAREAQFSIGIRGKVPMGDFSTVIPQYIDETMAWLTSKGVKPVGAPFMRYYVIDMDGNMDVEIGWRVADALDGDDRVVSGVIPAGRYGALIYTDVTQGIEGNRVLIEWAKDNNIEWDAWDTPEGHAFKSRVEFMLDGPDDDPDPTQWRTEVAILIADSES